MPNRISPEEAAKLGLKPRRVAGAEAAALGLKPSKGPKVPEEDAQSIPETALNSGMQGITYRTADELQGAFGAVDEAGNILREAVGLQDEPEVLADPLGGDDRKTAMERILASYEKYRDKDRAAVKKGERDNPKTAMGAELATSILAPMPIKGGLPLQGLAAGAMYGAGGSEAEDAEGLLLDTAVGGGVGWGTGKLMQGAGGWMKRQAAERALRAGGAQKPDFTALAKQSPSGDKRAMARKLGERLLTETDGDGRRVLGWFDNPEAIAPKLERATRESGEAVGGHVDVMQDAIAHTRSPRTSFPPLPAGAPEFAPVTGRPVSMVEIGKRLLAEADEAALQPGSKPYADNLRKEAETILQQAEARAAGGGYSSLTLPETEAAKKGLAGAVKKMNWLEQSTPQAEAKKQASRAFRKASEDTIGEMVGPDERAVFESLKGRYKDLRTLRDIAQRGEIAEAARMPLGLTEQNAMASAIATGGLPVEQLAKAGGAGILSRLTRGRGDAFAARTLDAAKGIPGEPANKALIQSLTPEEDERQRITRYLGLMD